MTMQDEPNVLYIDVETAPILGYTWGMYKENVLAVKEHPYILCASYAKNDDPVEFIRKARGQNCDDKALVKKIHALLEWADIVIAQNGDRFDIKVINERFLVHGLGPPSSYVTVDTLKVSRRKFRPASHSLKYRTEILDLTRKRDNIGIQLWLDCMAGKSAAWKEMTKYAIADTIGLREYYKVLLPWIDNHPNMGHWSNDPVCRNCGSANLIKWGWYLTAASRNQRYKCLECESTHTRSPYREGTPVLR